MAFSTTARSDYPVCEHMYKLRLRKMVSRARILKQAIVKCSSQRLISPCNEIMPDELGVTLGDGLTCSLE